MTLATKYRPRSLEDVVGLREVTEALEVNVPSASAILFHGPSGCGKTTLARIVAQMKGCDDVLEIDGATHTSVDAMREIAAMTQRHSLTGSGRCVIIDECHRLSRAAWESLLKVIEEPPKDFLWVFCTTEPNKILKTIKTRCQQYSVTPLTDSKARSLLAEVVASENLDTPTDIINEIVAVSSGSGRQLLTWLDQVKGCASIEDARRVMNEAAPGVEAYDFAKALVFGSSVDEALTILRKLKEQGVDAEAIRNVVFATATTAALKSGGLHFLKVLGQFEAPCYNHGVGDIVLRTHRSFHGRK